MAHHQPVRQRTNGAGEIPDKLYFRIGEVARLCDVPAYVLRFWESEFPQLKPNKGGTGQRLFRRRDVEMALRIKHLLYDEGYTIPGARQLLKAEPRQQEPDPQMTLAVVEEPRGETERGIDRGRIEALRRDLRDLLRTVSGPARRAETARPPRMPSGENLFAMPGDDRRSEEDEEP